MGEWHTFPLGTFFVTHEWKRKFPLNHYPTQEEIELATAGIRATWDDEEEQKRTAGAHRRVPAMIAENERMPSVGARRDSE